MRRVVVPVLGLLAALTPLSTMGPLSADVAAAATGGQQVGLAPQISPPAALSTSGDFATDSFSNPWDFSDNDDVIPVAGVGTNGDAITDDTGAGILTVATHNAAEIRLLFNWPGVLPWGHDGWAHPIDSSAYTQATFSIHADAALNMLVRWTNTDGQTGAVPFTVSGAAGFQTFHFDLADPATYPPGFDGRWVGQVVNFQIFRGNAAGGGNPAVNVQLDWVRLHRADAPQSPPAGVPVSHVLTPNAEGGADYATEQLGNPWDFAGLEDVAGSHDVTNLSTASGHLTGTAIHNDPWIGVPLGPPLQTDRYHRLTVDACYAGGFGLSGSAGGGMIGRMSWQVAGSTDAAVTQDFVVFPGCHRMTIDMITSPASAVNDEASPLVTGWRGMQPSSLRFDLEEDPGQRAFTLNGIRLADDAELSSTYPITFSNDAVSSPGALAVRTTADVYVSTNRNSFDGTLIKSGLTIGAGTNTFVWDGTDAAGTPMPNATYWVYVVQRNASGVGVGYSSGPVRVEKPVPPTPSYYVPLSPSRLLDTRDGEGGNVYPLATGVSTQLQVTGVGGVPYAGVTAVVMNVTVTNTTSAGFLTAWPSGDARPLVSNLNFVPGQTVPNLVTVKVGANGRVDLFNSSGSTDVIADVAGYYTSIPPGSGGRFTALTPARLLDTRDGTGTAGVIAAIGAQASIDLGVLGVGGVPSAGVTGVALNVTATGPTGTGFLTVWPSGEPRPLASTHNFVPGLTVANLVLAKVGSNGKVSIFNSSGSTDVVADVIGYFSASGGAFVPLSPQRLVDSRVGLGTPQAPLQLGESRTMGVAGGVPVPTKATAVVVNVTSVDSTQPSFITVWPTGSKQPLASTLNPRPGVPVPNQAYLRLGTNGSLDVFNSNGSTEVIIDVFGYVM